jgi:microcystin-dependent protein
MSDYSKATNFTTKDTLPTGNSGKIVKGTELDIEFIAIASAVASKADVSSPALLGVPTAPTAALGTNTTQIASCAFALANGVPSGSILLWSGSIASIPTGWVLCNGASGTPDLRNRFVVGAGSTYAVGATGGSADATLVSHSHTASSSSSVSDPGHNHRAPGQAQPGGGAADGSFDNYRNAGNGPYVNSNTTGISVSTSTSISTVGSSATNANLPPYYALAYIMKS